MATVGNNANLEYGYLRESFFTDEEKEHFIKLMQDDKERIVHGNMLAESPDKLYEKAMKLIERVENGEFNEDEMKKVERKISHLLAGIEDVHLECILEFLYKSDNNSDSDELGLI